MNVEVFLAKDEAFRDSLFYREADDFKKAFVSGVYPANPNLTFAVPDITIPLPLKWTAEIAFGVCNSYPDEMHCDETYAPETYAPVIEEYRANGNRSLSVGDMVVVDGRRFGCVSVGYVEF